MEKNYLEKLFNPSSIAVIGASDKPLSLGAAVFNNLRHSGFSGKLFPVNLHHSVIQNKPCFSSVKDIAEDIDLAIIAIPAATIPQVLTECGEHHIQKVIILSGGFSEQSERGVKLEQKLCAIARQFNIRFIGPNSLGIMRPSIRLNATFESHPVLRGNLAFISQSKTLVAAVLDWAAAKRIGFSTIVSLGNTADLSFGELLDYLALDTQTQCILLYVERIHDARRLISGIRAASHFKPVIVIKSGRNAQSTNTILSHTGTLISEDDVFDTALSRTGAIRVMGMKEFFSAAEVFACNCRSKGEGLTIITNSRSAGIIAADFATDLNIRLPKLSANTLEKIKALWPAQEPGHNPIDVLENAGPEEYFTVMESCLQDEQCHALLVLLIPASRSQAIKVAKKLIELSKQTNKPILACWMGQQQVKSSWSLFARNKIPHFSLPEIAIEAFSYLADYYHNQQLLMQIPDTLIPSNQSDIIGAQCIINKVIAEQRNLLTAIESRALLTTFGIATAQTSNLSGNDRELMVGILNDPTFGRVITFGAGGEMVELLPERALALPPLNQYWVKNLLSRSSIAPILGDFHNKPAANITGLEDTLLRISEMLCELPQIQEMIIDPLIVNDKETIAFNPRIAINNEAVTAPSSHITIHSYPNYLVSEYQLPQGEKLLIRPIRPEDANVEQKFIRHLSDSTKRFRFMGILHTLSPEMLLRTTQIDYDREMAMVAVIQRDAKDFIIGIAEYVANIDMHSCEFAVVVTDEWQNKGIGSYLMRCLINAAETQNLKIMEGSVLSVNADMLKLATNFGFSIKQDKEDITLKVVTKSLQPNKETGVYI
ncbi:bifunctional acetate--CoA ligase family protein/GNAT family N-acetyltransferase [Legionella fallonii]|uniref:Putative Acyl-CoA synthetase n=1 Tax=Legionella fallonii LLAP-10 TaxID=1212491 RepID=A0A098G6W5_9GAMM|nr:GNAT family N-acetyltransferase [Legionella fallonii]CEG57736.1 putative Acyl-CoA synthetase [Legionella fallonii LLAP-10]